MVVRGRGWLLLALIGALLAACTAAPGPPAWQRVGDLPTGFRAEVLVARGEELIIGGRSTDPQRPMLLVAADAEFREVPLVPVSVYGRTANLTAVAASADRLFAVGGDRGGAHGNVRWSVWSGTRSGVTEQEQSFWTFGGQEAGSLTALVAGPAGPVIIGNWGGRHGLDVTEWTVRGETWVRHDSAGTALASTEREVLRETAAAVRGDRVVVTGTALDLPAGLVPHAVTWVRDPGSDGWRRIDLPTAGTASSALDLDCAEDCLVAGVVDGRLAAWSGDGAEWQRVELPEVAADATAVMLRVFRSGSVWRIAVGRSDKITIVDPGSGEVAAGP
ncbi:MAG TPA: hypothetical protein VK020_10790, partial [Microlunatus sp.]|nr:hypothetical protein [Microlunatus sp.]